MVAYLNALVLSYKLTQLHLHWQQYVTGLTVFSLMVTQDVWTMKQDILLDLLLVCIQVVLH